MYIERNVDRTLWEAAKGWLVRKEDQARWISLVSAPGQGNTALLEHFQERTVEDTYGLAEARVILVRESYTESDHPPQALDPIARTVFELHVVASHTWPNRLKQWLHEFRVRRLLINTILIFLLLAVAVVVEEAQWPLHALSLAWWRGLLADVFSQHHLQKLIADAVVALLTAIIVELGLRTFRAGEEEERQSKAEARLRRKIESFRNGGPGLINALLDLCRRFRALILVIDNAYTLPLESKQLLQDFVHPSPNREAIQCFRKGQRVLLITLDMQSTAWNLPREARGNFQQLQVPPFNRLELQDILRHNASVVDGEQASSLLDEARQNVKALFVHQAKKLRDRVEEEYLREREAGTPGLFGHCELMAYWAALEHPSIERKELVTWIKALDDEHLRIFDLRPPEQIKELTGHFAKSCLVRSDRQTLYFDAAACTALRSWLQDDPQEKHILAQAHYFWLADSAKSVVRGEAVPQRINFPAVQQLAIKQAAWHARKLGALSEKASDVLAVANLRPEQRVLQRRQVAAVLLHAASIWRSEGDISESASSVLDALDWLPSNMSDHEQWVSFAAGQLWANYWMSGDLHSRERLESIARDFPVLTKDTQWVILQRYQELLRGRSSLTPLLAEPPPDQADLVNTHRLTSTLWAIRQSHGFLTDGLSDKAVFIPEPVTAEQEIWAEFTMWRLRAVALCLRGDRQGLDDALSKWRARLVAVGGSDLAIGMQAYYECQLATYWTVLLRFWSRQMQDIEKLPEAEAENARQQYSEWLATNRLTLKEPVTPENIFEEAQGHYRRALRMGALLECWPLLAEGGFHLGWLLLHFTPEALKQDQPPWWKEWDELFEGCLRVQQETGWSVYAPEIHRQRWEFFYAKEDRHASLTDAYNTLQSIKQSAYPDATVLRWHQLVSSLLTNYGDSLEDEKRSAELHEMWARDLASLPAASTLRDFKRSLLLEQSRALLFAAQARRQAREFERTEQLLSEAHGLFQDATGADHGEDPNKVYDLGISLRMQRAWLLGDRGDDARTAHRLTREVWRDLRIDGQHNANVLGSLVRAEEEEKLLDDAWPPRRGTAANVDPDNQAFSLPPEWFTGPDAIQVRNRYEFRFRQLLHMVSTRRDPTESELAFSMEWRGLEHFGETALVFAKADTLGRYSRTTKPLLITLLKAAALYFASVEPEDENEMRSLRLLMEYEPELAEHRIKYIEVLVKHKELLKRELHMAGLEQADWYSTAVRLDYYFSVLVDAKLWSTKLTEQLRRSGETPEQFEGVLQRRRDALTRARTCWRGAKYKECQQELEPILGLRQDGWVFIGQLEALDMWLRCEQQVRHAPSSVVSERATRLRMLTMRYIGQFGGTIPEAEAQHLALELLDELQTLQRATVPGSSAAA